MYSESLTSTKNQDTENRRNLERCIERMADGDKEAAACLYERTGAAVYGFALSILKNAHDAEDVLQDTYIRIYGAASGYRPNGNPIPWIFTITRNLSLMKLRENRKITEMTEEEWEKLACRDSTGAAEDRIFLKTMLELLSAEERQIIVLHAVAGMKYKEMAALLEMPLPTVLSKYHRAMKKMERQLGKEKNRNEK